MTLFLTSHIGGSEFREGKWGPGPLLGDNSLVRQLRRCWRRDARVLFLAGDPGDTGNNDWQKTLFTYGFPYHGMTIGSYTICDDRNRDAARDLQAYDALILGGGHVPTQNRFFQELGLREKLKAFDGIVIGISAGTMNCAGEVYAMPEEPGEGRDPEYRRFIPGLGLTDIQVIPHYQKVKDNVLDGLRLFEQIGYPDSMGRVFYALPDGSYILQEEGRQTVYGEAWRIRDGILEKICESEKALRL